MVQGDAIVNPAVQFGDGVRCVGGALKRLYVKAVASGAATAPTGTDLSVKNASAALGDVIPAGGARYYYTFYRDPPTFACVSFAFNTTSAVKVQW